MSRRIIGSVVGALAAASLVAPVAHAGKPAKVTVRAEAPGKTLVEATLTTTRAQVVKDGNAAHACTGTSAAGALEQATAGRWTGSWFDSLGYAVNSIGGVKAPADFSAYWALWINGRVSSKGVCGAELQTGDEVLEFLCTSTPDFSSCTNLPLALEATRVHRGKVTLKVVRLKGDGRSDPVAGATISGGTKVVKSGSDGRAVVTLAAPGGALRATHAGDVPSAPLNCTLGGAGGACGSHDTLPPLLALHGLRDGATFTAAHAPRTLRGVARDAGGLADVAMRLTRRSAGRCTAFDGARARFRPCNGRRAPLVDVGGDTSWSYLLPAKLAPGSYGLLVIATDKAGNRTRVTVRFTVEA
ncbi:MAG TPA: hypothetical protein VFF79_08485 [Conexibacter sp.]|jgi:hypothetical protein|nr:hypothetical protein [Conexibacter sp.]